VGYSVATAPRLTRGGVRCFASRTVGLNGVRRGVFLAEMRAEADYDIVIVGAGPAGSTAACVLSRSGLRVLLLDKSRFPREKLCGGALTAKTVMLLQRIFGETRASLKERDVLDAESSLYELVQRGTSLGTFAARDPFFFVKRSVYDAVLLEKAKAAGAHVAESREVAAFDPEANEVLTSDGGRIRARFVIGADGARSVIRRAFPEDRFRRRAWRHRRGVALQVSAPRDAIDQDLRHPVLYLGYVRWGYCWAFPNRDRVVVGMGCLPKRNSKPLGQLFRAFLANAGWSSLIERPVRACHIPYGDFLGRPTYRNALLVGDAAGFVGPISGEGIYYAQRSGELAARAILASLDGHLDHESRYVRLLNAHFLPELRRHRRARWVLFECLLRQPTAVSTLMLRALHRTVESVIHGVRMES